MILESHGAVVFVIDAQDKPYHYPIQNFIDTVRTVKMFNEAFEFEVRNELSRKCCTDEARCFVG